MMTAYPVAVLAAQHLTDCFLWGVAMFQARSEADEAEKAGGVVTIDGVRLAAALAFADGETRAFAWLRAFVLTGCGVAKGRG